MAVADGIVAEAGSDGAQGNYAYLYDPEAERTYVYMHMIRAAEVKAGERVDAGDPVGAVGCTGSCWGDHLHFEVHAGRGIAGPAQDPLPLLRDWKRPPQR
jgi:murein DD-endopeptidase MepM/ murein hydrolase activator NlpD